MHINTHPEREDKDKMNEKRNRTRVWGKQCAQQESDSGTVESRSMHWRGRRGWCSDVTLVRAPPAMTWRVKMNPPLQGCRGSSRLSSEYLTSSSHSAHTQPLSHTHARQPDLRSARIRSAFRCSHWREKLKVEKNWKRKMKNAGWQLTKQTRSVTERLKKHHAFWLSLSF